MADRVIIAWNFRNWLTIVLMAALGMALIGVVVAFLKSNLPGSAANNPQAQAMPASGGG